MAKKSGMNNSDRNTMRKMIAANPNVTPEEVASACRCNPSVVKGLMEKKEMSPQQRAAITRAANKARADSVAEDVADDAHLSEMPAD